MNFISSPRPVPASHEEQIAILFRGELMESETLSRHTGRPYAVTAQICWGDRRLRVICVHLSGNVLKSIRSFFASGITRLKEAGRLWEYLDQAGEEVIVAGDFNAVLGMAEFTGMVCRLKWKPGFHLTYPSELPLVQIDHVFCRGSLYVSSIGGIQSPHSDHRPVLAEIQLTEVQPDERE